MPHDEFGWGYNIPHDEYGYFSERPLKDDEEHPTDQLIQELEEIPDEEDV